jgi:hypothetical protein
MQIAPLLVLKVVLSARVHFTSLKCCSNCQRHRNIMHWLHPQPLPMNRIGLLEGELLVNMDLVVCICHFI